MLFRTRDRINSNYSDVYALFMGSAMTVTYISEDFKCEQELSYTVLSEWF